MNCRVPGCPQEANRAGRLCEIHEDEIIRRRVALVNCRDVKDIKEFLAKHVLPHLEYKR